MKVFVLATFLAALASAASAQYAIDWHKIAGGGGTSTNGQYSLSGTIGQHDAGGPMTNGPYSVSGGFWVLPVVIQTPGAPTLVIAPGAPGFATISWTPATPGFVLQESWSLTAPNWTNAPSGAANPVSVAVTNAARFYRLATP